MKTLIVLVFFIITMGWAIAQEVSPLPKIIEKIESYYIANTSIKVFIQTDKSIYMPGETIWFDVWAIDESTKMLISSSTDIIIQLLNSEGNLIASNKYLLKNGKLKGDILLRNEILKGNYFITGILPSHKDVDQLGFCKIGVTPCNANSIFFSIQPKASVLKKSMNNEICIIAKGVKVDIVKKLKIQYCIKEGETIIQQGKLKTDEQGRAIVVFQIPEKNKGIPYRMFVTDEYGGKETFVNLVSQSDQIQIKFYPEGGRLIPEIAMKVGFYAANLYGVPVNIEGRVIDQEKNTIVFVKSLCNGYGVFPINATREGQYLFEITSNPGQGQLVKLPETNPEGMSFSITKTDDNFLYTSVVFADKQAHNIALIVSNRENIFWSAELKINGSGNLKIPIYDLQPGLMQVQCFSMDGVLLAERLVYNSEKEELKIQLSTENESVKKGDEIEIKIKVTDQSGQPTGGKFLLAVSDSVFNDTLSSVMPIELELNCFLKNRIPMNDMKWTQNVHYKTLFDCCLLANELKSQGIDKRIGLKGDDSLNDNPALRNRHENKIDDQLAKVVKLQSLAYNSPEFNLVTQKYFDENKELICNRTSDNTETVAKKGSYKDFLSTGTPLMDIIYMIRPFIQIGDKIVFSGPNSFLSQQGALLVMDGQLIGENWSILRNYSSFDIDEIKVSTSPSDILRYTSFNTVGVVEITTKKGIRTLNTNNGEQNISNEGYSIGRDFSQENEKSKELHTTLYWNPNLEVDNTGIATIKISASQIVSDFIIRVTGIGDNGQLGYATKNFKVSK